MESAARRRARSEHDDRWGAPDVVARAPGRVNIIGEHTDYNEGFCLPMALEYETVVALSDTRDATDRVVVHADGFGVAEFTTERPADAPAWALHVAGVCAELERLGVPGGGWNGTVATDIPVGAGLSSSAAIQVAITTALLGRAGISWPPGDVASLAQRVENHHVGVPSGIMDQLICAGARVGHASLLDCRALSLEHAPVPDALVIAVLDTGTRRRLVDGEYRLRRESCDRAAASLGVAALRDASIDDLERIADLDDRRRARHVVTENERTRLAARALRADDPVELGRLMSASHHSLRHDFEVSGPGLDAIVDVAQRAPGCFGARMTGGGFAGCAVAAVDATRVEEFSRSVIADYDHDGKTARVWTSRPAAGASLLDS